MVGHGGSSAGSYLADPTSPIPSHCASIVVTSTVRVNLIHHTLVIEFALFMRHGEKKVTYVLLVCKSMRVALPI